MTERIGGRLRMKIRARVLAANPLCVMCQAKGITTLATEVDHIVALTNGGAEDPHDDSNRQGLCGPCHEIKTNADLGYAPKVATGADGWPVEAMPDRSSTARWKRADRG
jgi:5-methylcytosine-specific restriction enzyme A